jgi:hypothetical protein
VKIPLLPALLLRDRHQNVSSPKQRKKRSYAEEKEKSYSILPDSITSPE